LIKHRGARSVAQIQVMQDSQVQLRVGGFRVQGQRGFISAAGFVETAFAAQRNALLVQSVRVIRGIRILGAV